MLNCQGKAINTFKAIATYFFKSFRTYQHMKHYLSKLVQHVYKSCLYFIKNACLTSRVLKLNQSYLYFCMFLQVLGATDILKLFAQFILLVQTLHIIGIGTLYKLISGHELSHSNLQCVNACINLCTHTIRHNFASLYVACYSVLDFIILIHVSRYHKQKNAF